MPAIPSPPPHIANGPFYFAWVPPHTDFNSGSMAIQDEYIFSFNLTHDEGQAAKLTLIIANPHIGLLNPGRNQWAWFWWDNHGTAVPLFYGRLVSVPTDMLSETVQIVLVASPTDVLEQKQVLAEAMQVRPFWDPVFIEPANRLDPDNVLEGYASMWHISRGAEGLAELPVSTSDLIVGEDGAIAFNTSPNTAFYDSVNMSIDKAPLQSVYVDATVSWNQQAFGYLDMGILNPGTVFNWESLLQNWPKAFTNYGGGWTCFFSQAYDLAHLNAMQLVTTTSHYKNIDDKHHFGDVMSVDISWSRPVPLGTANPNQGLVFGLTPIQLGAIISVTDIPAIISESPNFKDQPTAKVSVTSEYVIIANGSLGFRQILSYNANRPRTENLRFTLAADLQPVFTDPGDVAANFAQDSELLSVQGNVGNEGPFGRYVGQWAPNTLYHLYDYFWVALVPPGGSQAFIFGYQVVRDNVLSLAAFDPLSTASVWQPFTFYPQGVSVFAGGRYWTVVVSHESGIGFNAGDFDVDGNLIYQLQINPDAGMPTYQEIPHFRGPWIPDYTYVPGDIVIAPSGQYFKVLIGHVSALPFQQYTIDSTGRLLYSMMLNPPAIITLAANNYFPSDRGLWSLEYLISRARAQLIDRSRVVKISFDVPFMDQDIQLSCRLNATITDPRLPGGTATGKIVSYTMKGDGDNAPITNITIACAVGNGNSVHTPSGGAPSYVDITYVEPGYQAYTGQQAISTDVIFSQPQIDANGDDGLNLLIPLTKQDAVITSVFENTHPTFNISSISPQPLDNSSPASSFGSQVNFTDNVPTYQQAFSSIASAFGPEDTALTSAAGAIWDQIQSISAFYILVLKPLNNSYSVEYDVETALVPMIKQIDLSAPSA